MSSNEQQKKKALRDEMLARRNGLSIEERAPYDHEICTKLWQLVTDRGFQTIHTFLPMSSEVNITPFIQNLLSAEKTVVAPRALPGRLMENLVLKSLDLLEDGVYGTKHPRGRKTYHGNYDLIVVPGLAFDANRQRLGYGAGYYDQFLQEQPQALKVGVAYPVQLINQVPHESHDVPLDLIIS